MRYIDYLLNYVASEAEKEDFSLLFKKLHSLEYYWVLRLDANRDTEGRFLRGRYLCELYPDVDRENLDVPDGPATLLETFVGLSKHLADDMLYGTEYGPDSVFWLILRAIGIDSQTDRNYDETRIMVGCEEFLDDASESLWSKVSKLVWNEHEIEITTGDY